MAETIVVVESPAKAKTINKYLGKGYHVLASYGHIRDLPSKDGSVNPDDDFAMLWEVDKDSEKRVAEIAKAVKGADKLILATDPDREGEAISWHVLEVLKAKKVLKDVAVERVTFNAITKSSIDAAFKAPRPIDQALVDAYLARRALDYLVGFSISPVLWRKLPSVRSAGRVQSVALRILCDREDEIERFVREDYWSVTAQMLSSAGDAFEARLVGADGKKLQRLDIKSDAQAQDYAAHLRSATHAIAEVERKPVKRNPPAPFTTSTLQQEASRKLGWSASKTMQVAQKLYEGVNAGDETVGLITYMRTDGISMIPEAVGYARSCIEKEFGKNYVPDSPRMFKNKSKNAQEAHEAVRPTDFRRLPKQLKAHLERDHFALYDLIWKRAMASQMAAADTERTTLDIDAKAGARVLNLRATGTIITFDGFLTLYQEGKDDEEDEDSARLPMLKLGEALKCGDVKTEGHTTEPPPRYTDATLIKKLEELGIGRPSTYASILAVLLSRGYVYVDKKRQIPEEKGRIVTAFLASFFTQYVAYDFTAELEDKLDAISDGQADWKEILREFWTGLSIKIGEAKELRTTVVLDALNDLLADHLFPAKADGSAPRKCGACETGILSLKMGKFGPFIGCNNYPECRNVKQLDAQSGEAGEEDGAARNAEPIILGQHPMSGEDISLRVGPYGPYVQLGADKKPKRVNAPKELMVEGELSFERALQLIDLPRTVGQDPETGQDILANIGRYGPYVQQDKTFASLATVEDVFTVGLNHAVTLIADKKSGKFSRFPKKNEDGTTPATPAGVEVGAHPQTGEMMKALSGRFGPYVEMGKVRAPLPRGTDIANVSLEIAVVAVDKKRAAIAEGGDTPKKPFKKFAKKK